MPTPQRRRGVQIRRLLSAAVASSVLLAGCTSGDETTDAADASAPATPPESGVPTPTTAAPAPPPPGPKGEDDPALHGFYTQKLAWSACKDDPATEDHDERAFQCAKLRVPLDYANAAARSIDIAVMRYKAAKPASRIGSLLTNPGGPGASGLEYLKQAYTAFEGVIHDRFDVVAFDPRGTGGSAPIECLDDAALDVRNAEDGPDPDDKQASEAFSDKRAQEFAAACQAKSGDLLPFVGTRNVARDMDILRAAVGDASLNYVGISYGTYLGALYIEEFPDKVGRLVLDGAVDPNADPLEDRVDQAIGFEQSFTRFARDCAAQVGCPLGRDPDKAVGIAVDFLDGLREKPLPTRDKKRKLTSSLGWTGAMSLLYGDEETTWKYLREALTYAMKQGDGTPLLFYADNYNGRSEDGKYNALSEAFTAIQCADVVAEAPSPERVKEVVAKIRAEAPLTARDVTEADFDGPSCEFWPYKTPEKPHTVKAPADRPVLVVGTTGDPATPYAASEQLAAGLEHAVLLTLEGEGHGAYGRGSTCIDSAVNAYLTDGQMPARGKRCK